MFFPLTRNTNKANIAAGERCQWKLAMQQQAAATSLGVSCHLHGRVQPVWFTSSSHMLQLLQQVVPCAAAPQANMRRAALQWPRWVPTRQGMSRAPITLRSPSTASMRQPPHWTPPTPPALTPKQTREPRWLLLAAGR